MSLRLGNAPCSWGTIEGFEDGRVPFGRMLDELAATGYAGTELGDYGYMPTEPARLHEELERRGLVMLGAFEGVPLARPGAVAEAWPRVRQIARLLSGVADLDARRPLVVLADQNNVDRVRQRVAGSARAEHALPPEGMRAFGGAANELARRVLDDTGLRTVFHPHCAGFVETPAEIDAFLDATDSALVSLVFDTGHATYGSGEDDDGATARALLARYLARTRYVHFKDCHPGVAARARSAHWDYATAVRRGVFCELGQGTVDFAGVLSDLRARDYDDWITVEQDVLPGMGTPRASAQRNRAYLQGLGL